MDGPFFCHEKKRGTRKKKTFFCARLSIKSRERRFLRGGRTMERITVFVTTPTAHCWPPATKRGPWSGNIPWRRATYAARAGRPRMDPGVEREPDSREHFAEALDRELRAVNSDYDAKRQTGARSAPHPCRAAGERRCAGCRRRARTSCPACATTVRLWNSY